MTRVVDPSGYRTKALTCLVQGAVATEVARLRGPGSVPLPAGRWSGTTPLGDGGLGIDSLEMLGILAALADLFGLDATTLTEQPSGRLGDLVEWVAGVPDNPDMTVTVTTSGSTGAPKRCTHRMSDLMDEAAFFAAMTVGRRRIVVLVPTHHIYGLIWGALLPAVLDVPAVDLRLGARLDLSPGDLVVAVPEQWRALLRLAGSLPADLWAISSGGPLPPDVEDGLRGSGLVRVLDVYGASELGGIAVRTLPNPDHRLLPRWRLAGGEDAVLDRQGRRFVLPDHVMRVDERSIRPTRRRDDAVQVGGCNVWPALVATTLRRTTGVAEIAVRLGSDGRLKAFVVPEAGVAVDDLAERLWRSAAALPAAERPSTIAFGPELPRNTMGKPGEWA